WRVVGAANRYVDEQAPWALRRNDAARMKTVLYTLAEVLRHLGILTQPFVPDAASALLDQLAVPKEARRFADLADALPSGGVHPHEAADYAETTADELATLAAQQRVIGIGETGLDFHYDHSPRDVQERIFRTQIAAARVSGLPLIIHAREADAEIAHILQEEGAAAGVLHCFSSGRALAEAALDLGFYISISGIVP